MSDNCGNNEVLSKISAAFTESLLLQILKESSGKEDAELVGYKFAGGSAKGDGYLSVVNRLILEGTAADGAHISAAIIVKSLPGNLGRRKTFRSEEFFRNEAAFYNEVLPRLNAFQEKKNLQCPFNEIPRCFKAFADGKNDIIVLEDLSAQGFKLANRLEALDLEHCKIVLKSLARFHALSFAMKDQEPEEFKNAADAIKETYFSEETREWYKGITNIVYKLAEDAVSIEFPNSVYERKTKELLGNDVFSRILQLVKVKEPSSVLLNGDVWVNNLLFKYEDSKIAGVNLIDFQLSRYASPVLDFSVFIYTCTTQEQRNTHFDELLNLYYKTLSEFVTDLGSDLSKVYPYNNFLKEVKEMSAFGLIFSIECIPYATIDENQTPDIESIEGDEAISLEKAMYLPPMTNKNKRLRLASVLVDAIDRGFI